MPWRQDPLLVYYCLWSADVTKASYLIWAIGQSSRSWWSPRHAWPATVNWWFMQAVGPSPGPCLVHRPAVCIVPVYCIDIPARGGGGGGGGGTRSENCWGCAVGHWKLDPKRSRGKWYFGAKQIEFCEDLYPKDRFCVGGWEKTPQKDRVWYPEAQKRGSKPRHICITHHIGSTPNPPPPPPPPPGIPETVTCIAIWSKSLIVYVRKIHMCIFTGSTGRSLS